MKKMPNLAENIPRERLPSWFANDILDPFEAGTSSVFIVHGDINCILLNPGAGDNLDSQYIKLREFWRKILKEYRLVVFYNIASGLSFLKPEMEVDFRKTAGVVEQESVVVNPAIAAARADLSNRRPLPTEPDVCLNLIDKALRKEKNMAVIVNSAHFIAPMGSGSVAISPVDRVNIERLRNWSQSETIRANKNIVFLLTDQAAKISSELRQSGNEIQAAFINKPGSEERKNYIRAYTEGSGEQAELLKRLKMWTSRIAKQKNDFDTRYIGTQIDKINGKLSAYPELYILADDLDINAFTVATQALSLGQVRELLIESKKTGLPLGLAAVKDKKYKILSNEFSDVMEIVSADKGLEDIGGMEHLKRFFRRLLEAIRKGDIRRVPMGVTLMGPPGTGKTAFVEALAKEAGFHFAKMKNMRTMWLGESEAKMDKWINGLWSLIPIVVMNDEADLADADRDAPKGDSGVSERLMRSWMTFLSNPKIRGKVIVINCTNRPDRMDAALLRSGRSDKRILLPMPSVEEIPAIFEVMFRRYGIPTSVKNFSKYAQMVDGRSGADIEAISLSSLDFASRDGREEDEIIVNDEALVKAIDDSIPGSSQSEIDYMTLCGLLMSSSRELLPPNIGKIVADIKKRDLVPNADEIFAKIKARQIVVLDKVPQFSIN